MSDLSTTIAHPSVDGHNRPFIDAGTGVLTPTSTLQSQVLASNGKAKRDGRIFGTGQKSPASGASQAQLSASQPTKPHQKRYSLARSASRQGAKKSTRSLLNPGGLTHFNFI